MDLLRHGQSMMEALRGRHATHLVTFVRGSDGGGVSVSATVGRSIFEHYDTRGALIRIEARDFLIAALPLAFDGVSYEPERGDRIIERIEDRILICEVMSPTTSDPCWRWSDEYRLARRIHTKVISEQTVAQ